MVHDSLCEIFQRRIAGVICRSHDEVTRKHFEAYAGFQDRRSCPDSTTIPRRAKRSVSCRSLIKRWWSFSISGASSVMTDSKRDQLRQGRNGSRQARRRRGARFQQHSTAVAFHHSIRAVAQRLQRVSESVAPGAADDPVLPANAMQSSTSTRFHQWKICRLSGDTN
jgi:hypothetical protein